MDQEPATNREEFQDRPYSPLNIATVWPGYYTGSKIVNGIYLSSTWRIQEKHWRIYIFIPYDRYYWHILPKNLHAETVKKSGPVITKKKIVLFLEFFLELWFFLEKF